MTSTISNDQRKVGATTMRQNQSLSHCEMVTSNNISNLINEETPLISRNKKDDGINTNSIDTADTTAATTTQEDVIRARRTTINWIIVSILFAANHGSVTSCLHLATAKLGGEVGSWQSGTLYLTYTLSALLGASYVVKLFGSRNSLILGMSLCNIYVICFLIATQYPVVKTIAAYVGAGIGGIGGGFLWTAQGSYFTSASAIHAKQILCHGPYCTSFFAGLFAFIYLVEEVGLTSLSTLLLSLERTYISWNTIFTTYAFISITSTIGMLLVQNYDNNISCNPDSSITEPSNEVNESEDDSSLSTSSISSSSSISPSINITPKTKNNNNNNNLLSTIYLLLNDRKMKWLIGLCSVFGFSSSFINSYVNGQVVRIVLNDDESKYVGILIAFSALIAAIFSLLFSQLSQYLNKKGPVLIVGCISYICVALPFVIWPNIVDDNWSLSMLILIYIFHGIGRATFESTLKALFSDYFGKKDKEGAFANIILQNGLATAIGYILSFKLSCNNNPTTNSIDSTIPIVVDAIDSNNNNNILSPEATTPTDDIMSLLSGNSSSINNNIPAYTSSSSQYCVQFHDGSYHDILSFELIIIITAIIAMIGYWRASVIHDNEQKQKKQQQQKLSANNTDTEMNLLV